MPSLWDDDGKDKPVKGRGTTNLSGGKRFSTRDFAVDQSLNLMFVGDSPATNLSAPAGTGSSGFTSRVAGLFRGSGGTNAPPQYDEYGDAAPSTESEEYISDKSRRTSPILTLIRGCMGTKAFIVVVLGLGFVLLGVLLGGNRRRASTMKRYFVDHGISPASAFDDSDSPQSLALKWLTKKDPAKLNPADPGAVDRYILAVFYYGSNGQQGGWKSSTNWLTRKGVCSWEGVECIPKEVNGEDLPTRSYDANGSIIGFALPSNGMKGTIPSEFAQFPELMTLDLSDNGISGTIPTIFGKMDKVRNLIFWKNALAGTFPNELTALTRLYQLNLGDNQLTGYISDDISLMTSLRTLSLSSNKFEGFFPYVEDCLKLVRLHVDNNKFGATLPAWLGSLTELKDLRANNNAFMGGVPTSIQQSVNLQTLHLDHNKLKHKLPDIFNRLDRLTELKLHRNAFTGSIPSTIYFLQGLKILTLDNNKFSGTIRQEIGLLEDVEVLSLHLNQLGGSIPSQLGLLNDIQSLSLHSNKFSGSLPSDLGNCFRLTSLTVDQNSLTGSIPTELASLDHLEELQLEMNNFSGEIPSEVCALKTNDVLGYISADCKGKMTCSCCDQCL